MLLDECMRASSGLLSHTKRVAQQIAGRMGYVVALMNHMRGWALKGESAHRKGVGQFSQ